MPRDIDRRSVLKAAGAVGITAPFAGCVGGDSGGNGNGNKTSGNGNGKTDSGSGSGLGDRTIKYGVLMPETGDLGSLGKPIRDGARLPAKQLQDQIGASFDVQTGDTQTKPQAGISAANSLVDSGYPAVVGPAASNVNLQVTRQSFIPNEVVGISPSSTAPAVTKLKDNGYIFRTAPSDALQGPVIAQVASKQFDSPKTCSTMFLNDAYGQALEQEFVKAFKNEQGGKVLERVSFESKQASYSSQLETAMGADPDFLFVVGFPQSGIQLFRDFYNNYDSSFPVIVPDGLIDSKLPKNVGNPMNNVWGTAPAAGGPSADKFASLYKNQWGSEPGVFNSHAYDAAAVVVLANARAGENTGSKIRDNMKAVANPGGKKITASNLAEGVKMAASGKDIKYQGASSVCDFDDNGDMKAVTYEVKRYKNKKIKTVRSIDFSN